MITGHAAANGSEAVEKATCPTLPAVNSLVCPKPLW